ncbi:hypothetical protein BDU57DRAFT_97498 [Ampelomyces quisqualis]|uniref:Uncharacterized protein n=1 Tax=Ampelomyces quisqualis TaxID=50730 RepID=A0A6A5Q6Z6_AMPQU|nr:hypothetical protein BDU57DRAFT_97498 [Ampelomyces quisqualis]
MTKLSAMIPEPNPPYEYSNTNFREPADGHLIQSLPLQRDITRKRSSLRRSGSPAKEKIHLDFTQRFERKLAEYNGSENVFKRWLFEIICWLISAVSMGAIVAIYIWLQNRPFATAEAQRTAKVCCIVIVLVRVESLIVRRLKLSTGRHY